MDGMSGTRTRHLYNNLCSLDIGRKIEYLEVGTWKGSSVISAMYGNESKTNATTVDNWSQFNGPKDEFLENIRQFGISPTVVDMDCFQYKPPKKIDIFLYDGDHTYEAHKKAMEYYWPHLQDSAIVIVDDWNFESVSRGTLDGIPSNSIVWMCQLQFKYLGKSYNGFHNKGYWNGIALFVIQKQQ
jgi:hypothetical protein